MSTCKLHGEPNRWLPTIVSDNWPTHVYAGFGTWGDTCGRVAFSLSVQLIKGTKAVNVSFSFHLNLILELVRLGC